MVSHIQAIIPLKYIPLLRRGISPVIITGIQLVACSIAIIDTRINISAETRLPLESPKPSSDVIWKNWTWPEDMSVSDPRLLAVR